MKIYHIQTRPNIKLRIIATLIDYGIYFTVAITYIMFFGEENGNGTTSVNGLAALPVFILWFLYFVVTEAVNQATPGHDICKLKVVGMKGEKIGFTQAFKRRVVDPIDLLPYGIPAFICINKTPKYQRLGDLFAETLVVKRSDIVEEEVSF
ncbi:RDD family protein [Mucilaginibacter myungsuensis]|uniref:RDD family protein n=1 Tax=Mucilaginibacter myungsuensis TaxID=649104 RepID=A0A929PXQ9_9SPHI|nr:RDD family protein [Mucilaginibacter myungsuensis]MBE9662527.1 RDD family protein [Mucilaginibacter myungsuensis]MDN3597946.1 RDD family protein [Mucilaginibacter myungsuensis]